MTLFPDMCRAYLSESIIGRARAAGKVQIECTDIRDYTEDKHRRVDDTPYGGGMGMMGSSSAGSVSITLKDDASVDTDTYVQNLREKTSGLKEAVRVLRDVEGIGICELTGQDVVRHMMVQRIIKAYDLSFSFDKSII